MRSSSGPERRRRWRTRSACEHWQRVPPSPHGHGFDAATSMKRVGKTMTCWPRTIVTWPSSSGWRSASRLGRANSDSSSRNSTPRCASVASPGCGGFAPPTSPAAETVWCGARNGRAVTSPAAPRRPATDWMRVTSIASSGAERRQDRRQPPRDHRLARAGRALQEQVVAARRGDLEPGDQPVVAADVGELGLRLAGVRRPRRAAPAAPRRRAGSRRAAAATRCPTTSMSAHQRRLARPRARQHEPPQLVRGARPRRPPARRGPAAPRPSATARRRPRSPRSRPGSSWPDATSSATASGRSNAGPTLRR